MQPNRHRRGPKPPGERPPTFCSSRPSPRLCLLPINNRESVTSKRSDNAAPCHGPTEANGFYFYTFGENHVSAIDNTQKEKKKNIPGTRIPTPPPPSAQTDLRQAPGGPICSSPASIWVADTSNSRLTFSHVGVCCLSDEAVCAPIVLRHPEGFSEPSQNTACQ